MSPRDIGVAVSRWQKITLEGFGVTRFTHNNSLRDDASRRSVFCFLRSYG